MYNNVTMVDNIVYLKFVERAGLKYSHDKTKKSQKYLKKNF